MAPHLSSELASSQAWLFYMLGRGAQGQALSSVGKKSGRQAAVGFLTVHCWGEHEVASTGAQEAPSHL